MGAASTRGPGVARAARLSCRLGRLRPLSWDPPRGERAGEGAPDSRGAARRRPVADRGQRSSPGPRADACSASGSGCGVRVEAARLRVEPARAVPGFETSCPATSPRRPVRRRRPRVRPGAARAGLRTQRDAPRLPRGRLRRIERRVETSRRAAPSASPGFRARVSQGRLRAASVGTRGGARPHRRGAADRGPGARRRGSHRGARRGRAAAQGERPARRHPPARRGAWRSDRAARGRVPGGGPAASSPAGPWTRGAITGSPWRPPSRRPARGRVRVKDIDCARISYPDFVRDYRTLGGTVA